MNFEKIEKISLIRIKRWNLKDKLRYSTIDNEVFQLNGLVRQ